METLSTIQITEEIMQDTKKAAESIDGNFNGLRLAIANFETDFNKIDGRFRNNEKILGGINENLIAINTNQIQLNTKISEMDDKLNKILQGLNKP